MYTLFYIRGVEDMWTCHITTSLITSGLHYITTCSGILTYLVHDLEAITPRLLHALEAITLQLLHALEAIMLRLLLTLEALMLRHINLSFIRPGSYIMLSYKSCFTYIQSRYIYLTERKGIKDTMQISGALPPLYWYIWEYQKKSSAIRIDFCSI